MKTGNNKESFNEDKSNAKDTPFTKNKEQISMFECCKMKQNLNKVQLNVSNDKGFEQNKNTPEIKC